MDLQCALKWIVSAGSWWQAEGITVMDMRHALLAVGILTMTGCDGLTSRYAAEVGYHDGGEIKWEIWGDFASLDECKSAAMARYNFYFASKRAQSWACLLKNGHGGYVSKHR
jgi:hypothetical protein